MISGSCRYLSRPLSLSAARSLSENNKTSTRTAAATARITCRCKLFIDACDSLRACFRCICAVTLLFLQTTFLIVVAVVYDPWQIGAALLVAFMVILFGSFLIPVLTARFPWLIKWAVGGGLCVLVAFAAGVGSQEGYGFVGFSLAWGILFLCLSVAAWQAHRNASRTAVLSHMCSPGLFPVYGYSTQPGVRNPLHSDNSRVYLVYAALCTLLVWGLLAIFFVPNTWIGLGVHAIAIVLMLLYAMESTTRPRILLARAVRYLGEMTPQYEEAVHRAKLAAFRAQLSSIKVTSNSPDQQQQHAEAQTVVGSPESSRSAKGAAGDDSSSSPKPAGEGKNFLQRTLSMAAEAARSAEPEDLVLDDADLKLLGLDDPAKPLTELDWKGLYATLVSFRQATPMPSMLAFTKGAAVDVAMVSWRGQQVPRRRAHDLLLRLDHHVALLHTNYLAYQTHVAVELILASEAIKAEHEAEMITMLRDTGHAELSAEYLRALKPSDPERVAIEAALVEWKKKQEQVISAEGTNALAVLGFFYAVELLCSLRLVVGYRAFFFLLFFHSFCSAQSRPYSQARRGGGAHASARGRRATAHPRGGGARDPRATGADQGRRGGRPPQAGGTATARAGRAGRTGGADLPHAAGCQARG